MSDGKYFRVMGNMAMLRAEEGVHLTRTLARIAEMIARLARLVRETGEAVPTTNLRNALRMLRIIFLLHLKLKIQEHLRKKI